VQRTLRKAQRLAHLLDNAFRIPGTRWRIGWDSLIGLVPGVGDAVTGAVALWIVLEARRLGAPRVRRHVCYGTCSSMLRAGLFR